MRGDFCQVILNKHSYFGMAQSYDEIEVALFRSGIRSVNIFFVWELTNNKIINEYKLNTGDIRFIERRAKELITEQYYTQYVFNMHTGQWFKQ